MSCDIKKCLAECCYSPPLPKAFIEKYKVLQVRPVIRYDPIGDSIFGKENVYPVTSEDPEQNKCPFLTDENRCNSYDHRPKICRVFGTNFKCRFNYKL